MVKKNSGSYQIENILWESSNPLVSYQISIEVLADEIKTGMEKEKINFDYICGVPRGGLIPAVSLSHILGIPVIEYSDEMLFSNNVLFVEDIIRSGTPINRLPLEHNVLNNRLVAFAVSENMLDNSMVWKSAIEVGKNVYVQFPWEMVMTDKQIVKFMKNHVVREKYDAGDTE